MDTLHTANHDLKVLRDDFADLKHDVTSLLKHLKTGGTHDAQIAVEQMDDQAQRFFKAADLRSRQSIRAINTQIEHRPLTAALILVGLGFLSAKLLTR